jgi:hypothetical protein
MSAVKNRNSKPFAVVDCAPISDDVATTGVIVAVLEREYGSAHWSDFSLSTSDEGHHQRQESGLCGY